MNDTRAALPIGLKHILDAICADPEVHLPELVDWVDRMFPEAEQSGSVVYALLKQACLDRTNSLYHWLESLFRDIDKQTLYHLSEAEGAAVLYPGALGHDRRDHPRQAGPVDQSSLRRTHRYR